MSDRADEPRSAMLLTEHEWALLAAICESYLSAASDNAHAAKALCHRVLESTRG